VMATAATAATRRLGCFMNSILPSADID
jgi:hypothetical protein